MTRRAFTHYCPICKWRFTPQCASCQKAGVRCPRCGRPAQKNS